ncbi:MAG TPA: SdrD B-like domain-containing protein [Pyrinomonadaceae bacterium]|nr:SdrD B-like domain-containing protein [Pyrinomonadaceae bacterium]
MRRFHPNKSKTLRRTVKDFLTVLAFICLLNSFLRAFDDPSNPAGTIISNRAEATYTDETGTNYNTVSTTIRVTVAAVPSVTIAPDETAPSEVIAPNDRVTRVFRLCNTGNIADFYISKRAEVSAPAQISAVYYDLDNSGTITNSDAPVMLDQTLTPNLAPDACLNVLFDIETGNISPNGQIFINYEAQATLALPNSREFPKDSGTIINTVGNGVVLTSPTSPSLPPVKLVENQPRTTAAQGQVLNYKIRFKNSGSVVARNVRVTDDLPAQLEYVPNTLRLNNRTLTDTADTDEGTATASRLEFLLPTILPEAVTQLEFQARLSGTNPNGGGVVNFAVISAENAPTVNSTEAVAVINPVGVVFAGNSGGSVRVGGANITISTNENGTPVVFNPKLGYAANPENANPFSVNGNGEFSFALAQNQIGTSGNPARYVLNVSAPNFRPRLLELLISPSDGNGGFYKAKINSLDGQAVAIANGFSLTSSTVEIDSLAALVFNIPLFEVSTLEISKNADKQFAEIGDIVSYRVQLRNASASPLRETIVRDILPNGFVYASGTAAIETGRNKQTVEPEIQGNVLIFRIGELSAGASASITYRVRIGANVAEGEHFNSARAEGIQPNGETVSTPSARASVRVRGGVFSMRQIILGRVFEDKNKNGKFDEGERAASGVRIYLNNGNSVITDANGQYNFPAVEQGSAVLSLDPVTLPKDYVLLDDNSRRDANSWTRLLRTPLGGGSLLHQNFAIAPKTAEAEIDESYKFIDVSSKTATKINAPQTKTETAKTEINAKKSTETYTIETKENIEKVEAGEIFVVSPKADEVLMSPALSISARVAKDWKLEAEVNGEKVSSANIGETRIDNRNQIAVFSFVGINVRPGENLIRLTAIGANGERGKTSEIKVFGRGAVERLEIVNLKNESQTASNQTIPLKIRAFDRWGNPAADGQISVQTSAGKIVAANAADENAKQQTVSIENGEANLTLVGTGTTETSHLKAVAGNRETTADVRFSAEMRPTLMVGLAEISIGKNAPEIVNSGDEANWRGRVAFFYKGNVFGKNLLTFSYDSHRPLNRFNGRDRFGSFDPLERSYSVFGDSSQRFEDAPSNSKLYARLDRGLSYAMFGDMEADLNNSVLAGYNRHLTGAKIHLENENGDFVSVTGARPDTAFARDVFAGGGLSLMRLSHVDILPGSEVVSLEIRDRRNPEIIVSRENLIRSVDYNLDSQTGEIFFLRPITAFDYGFNLIQIVALYEYRAEGGANYVYTARANKNFKSLGLRLGASYVNQQQETIGAFQLGGIDAEKTLWNGGKLSFETALSRGRFASGVNVFDFYNVENGFVESDASRARNGAAFSVRLDQPLPLRSRLKADFTRSTENFYNPFGATVAAGNQRINAAFEFHPTAQRNFVFGFTDERNKTRNVNNSRLTFSALWSEQWRENLRTIVGFDHRIFNDNLSDRDVNSNLVTAGIEYRPTEKLELSVKREQNLTEADPTYPDQTTFAANYQIEKNTKLFFTQRLASAPITPIGDFSGSGFTATRARHETAIGIETKLKNFGALNGRYQLENGINGTDSFAVVGLQNRWNLNKEFGLEAGFERGFLLRGDGDSFNSGTLGFSWSPIEDFRATVRYELRDRNGFGQMFTLGAAGKIGDNWTTLARGQWARSSFDGRESFSSNITGATAFRPLRSDRYAFLFSYNQREISQDGQTVNGVQQDALRDRYHTLSYDEFVQVSDGLEVYGRFALRFNGNGNNSTEYASALTMLGQLRAQQKFGKFFDLAGEGRWLNQPSSATFRRSFGTEFGVWALPDLRFGVGYNFTDRVYANDTYQNNRFQRGTYFTITTKLSNLFNLFGTSRNGLASSETEAVPSVKIANNQEKKEE